MDDLAFLVIAPRLRIDDGVFAWDTSVDAIRRKVRRRVDDYAGERDAWFRDWFEPTLDRLDVRWLSWEDVIEVIAFHDPETGQLIDAFYGKCLRFNRPQAVARFPGRRSGTGSKRGRGRSDREHSPRRKPSWSARNGSSCSSRPSPCAARVLTVRRFARGTPAAVKVSAEELGKEFAPDTPDAGKAYRGKVIRVAGRVAMAHEPYVYLATGSNFPTGQPVRVTLDYKGAGVMPDFTAGDRVVVEGTIDRTGIFGPILIGCRVVQRSGREARRRRRRPGPPGGNEEGAERRKGAEKADDPGRFAPTTRRRHPEVSTAPVRAGEPGYRAECTSFRLRFGPGNWQGTAVGRSVAWGDGNQNKDHWGVGSGEQTFSLRGLRRRRRGVFRLLPERHRLGVGAGRGPVPPDPPRRQRRGGDGLDPRRKGALSHG